MEVNKILILGNSITRHAPKADIGWTMDCGMAASSLEKDYVHCLLQYLTLANKGKTPESIVKNIAAFEREYASYDITGALEPFSSFCPDVVVIAIGENIPAPKDKKEHETLLTSLQTLLKLIAQNGYPSIFIRSCFWADSVKDDLLRLVCAEAGGTFVDISSLHKDESNFARSERSFVNVDVSNHPGDRGMAAIADAIGKAINHAESRQTLNSVMF